MRKIYFQWGVVLTLLSMLLAPDLLAQPANDLICNATQLTLGTPVNSGNGGATPTGSPAVPPGSCFSDGTGTGVINGDVWFSFVAPAGTGGIVRITTTAGGMTDSQLQVWRATPASDCSGALSVVPGGCNDDFGSSFMSQVNINLANLLAGQTYFVQVDGWDGDTGTFGILAEYLIPPPPLQYPATIAQNLVTTYNDLGTSGSVITVANNDNATSAPQNIGFTFNFGQASYTQFRLNTNGFIKLGTIAPSVDSLMMIFGDGLQNAASTAAGEIGGAIFRNSIGDTAILAAFNHDLHEGLGGPAEFRVATDGTAPNRVCVIQFKNLKDKPTRSNGASNAPIPLNGALGDFYRNINFQIKLYETSNRIEFVYDTFQLANPGPGATLLKNAEIGIKGANNSSDQIRFIQKISSSSWAIATFQTATTQNIMNMRIAGARPDVRGRTFRFNEIKANDLAVTQIMSLGQRPIPNANPYETQVAIANAGTDTAFNVLVTLTISGANTFTNSKIIASLNPGASTVVVFDAQTSTNTGVDSITVSVPNDDNSENNSRLYLQEVNNSTFAYARVGQAPTSAFGATTGGSVLFTNRYFASTPTLILTVRTFIFNFAANIGQTIQGVVTDTTGAVLGQSPNYVVQASDLGTYVNLPINYSAFPIPSFNNEPFLVGMNHISTGTQSFPASFYNEFPKRLGTPVAYASALGGTPTARTGNEVWLTNAVVVDPTLPNRLSNFNLLTPANNTTVNLIGQDTTPVTATWSAAIDTGGLNVGYQWLLDAQGADFSQAILTASSNNGGGDTAITLTYVAVDDLLDALGFAVDSTDIDLIWTVRAIAGPNSRVALDTFNITFKRFGLNYLLCAPGNAANTNDFMDSVSITGELGTSIQFRNGRNGVNGGTTNQYRNFFDTAGFALAMLPGNSYPFNVQMGVLPAGQGPFDHSATVFIDWNKNNRFDDIDGAFFSDTLPSTSTAGALLSGSITIPTGTPLGVYRLRLVGGDVTGSLQGCNVEFGDVEDYKLTVGVSGGISITPWEEELQVFPNPSSGLVHVKFNYDKPTDVAIEIYNSMGALIKTQRSAGASNNQILLNLQGMSTGVYMVRFVTDGGITTRRVILD